MSDPENRLRQVHDVVLQKIELTDWKKKTYDIRNQVVSLTYCESITDVSPWGEVFMVDTVDFPTLLPMMGEEKLSVSFTRQETASKKNAFLGGQKNPIKFDMNIFRMSGKLQEGQSRKRQTYTLHYSTDLPYLNMANKVHTTFKAMKYSDIVKHIYETYLKKDGDAYKPLIVEETEGMADFYANNLYPLQVIYQVAAKSVSAEGNGNGYLFYEDINAYHFVTVGKLIKKEPSLKLTCELRHVTKNSKSSGLGRKDIDIDRQLYNVDNYIRNESFDTFKSAMGGEAVSSIMSIDPTVRRFYYNEFDLRGADKRGENHWEQRERLGKYRPWKDTNKMFIDPKANMMCMFTDQEMRQDEYVSSNTDELPIHSPEEHIMSLISLGAQLDKHTILVSLSGDPTVKAGDVIEFDIPEITGSSSAKNPMEKDKWLQGKYLVVGVGHSILNDKYKMFLTLVRDGFYTDIFHRNPVDYSASKRLK